MRGVIFVTGLCSELTLDLNLAFGFWDSQVCALFSPDHTTISLVLTLKVLQAGCLFLRCYIFHLIH